MKINTVGKCHLGSMLYIIYSPVVILTKKKNIKKKGIKRKKLLNL